MTQYEISNAVEKIGGYLTPRPGEAPEQAFLRARNEAAGNLQREMQNVEEISFDQFRYLRAK